MDDLGELLRALSFAASKHRVQRRKDAQASPYINHPIAVAALLASHGVTDLPTLIAAVLHDTLEDTDTSPAELEEAFGSAVSGLVQEVTDDKSLPKALRKTLQIDHAAVLSDRAKRIKLADKTCNLRDIIHDPPSDWPMERRLAYLDWAEQVVAGCRGSHARLEETFDAVLRLGRQTLH